MLSYLNFRIFTITRYGPQDKSSTLALPKCYINQLDGPRTSHKLPSNFHSLSIVGRDRGLYSSAPQGKTTLSIRFI